jgi:hypothetical protein
VFENILAASNKNLDVLMFCSNDGCHLGSVIVKMVIYKSKIITLNALFRKAGQNGRWVTFYRCCTLGIEVGKVACVSKLFLIPHFLCWFPSAYSLDPDRVLQNLKLSRLLLLGYARTFSP